MDQLTGAVFLCAMHAVVHTGGSIPSILIGVPGDGTGRATALDGCAMTKKGEGGRALGASFGAFDRRRPLGAMSGTRFPYWNDHSEFQSGEFSFSPFSASPSSRRCRATVSSRA